MMHGYGRWLLSAALGLAGPAWATSDTCGLLRQQTQAFSDAGQQGDAAVMSRLLDPNVVFVNEDGTTATRQDMVSGATPPPRQVSVQMTVTDWTCQIHSNVAVTGFVDDQRGTYYGQPMHAGFRSVETWLQEGAEWRMIGSETVALVDDPTPVKLSGGFLEAYVGTYAAAPDLRITITRRGDDLLASLNGGPPTLQKAEVRDVFFTPGRARFRKIFQRGAGGDVVSMLVRREGHDVVFKRV